MVLPAWVKEVALTSYDHGSGPEGVSALSDSLSHRGASWKYLWGGVGPTTQTGVTPPSRCPPEPAWCLRGQRLKCLRLPAAGCSSPRHPLPSGLLRISNLVSCVQATPGGHLPPCVLGSGRGTVAAGTRLFSTAVRARLGLPGGSENGDPLPTPSSPSAPARVAELRRPLCTRPGGSCLPGAALPPGLPPAGSPAQRSSGVFSACPCFSRPTSRVPVMTRLGPSQFPWVLSASTP